MPAKNDPESWLTPAAVNLAEVFAGTAERGGHRAARWDDGWAADPGVAEPLLNNVALLRPMTAATAVELTTRLDAFYGSAEGGDWTIWSAWPTPDLASLGYSLLGQPPLMVRPPGGDPVATPAGLRIVEATDEDELAAFERTLIEGYPAPSLQPVRAGMLFRPKALGGPTRFWLGYVHGRLVTVAVSCEAAGVVGVHFVATLADARGRGYGAAITDTAARVDPTLPALLQSSDLGRPVYERLGFETVAHFTLWQRGRGQGPGNGR